MKPDTAIVLAAGRGVRFRPLTDTIPKPLIMVAGKCLIDWQLDALREAGISKRVVNVSYLAGQIKAHLEKRRRLGEDIVISEEDDPLETGGGIANALHMLGDAPFYVLNSDVITLPGERPVYDALADAWTGDADALLLLIPLAKAIGYAGQGDFHLEPDGRLRRRGEGETAPYVFGGTQILHPRLFHDCPHGAFSLNLLYDRSRDAQGILHRVKGIVHTGEWLHVGDAEGKRLAETKLG